MRRASTVLVVIVLAVLLSACDDGDFDAADLRDIFDTLQDLEAEAGADSGGTGGSGDPGDAGATTDSPNRPPIPSGGVQNDSYHDASSERSFEEWEYSPVDRSHEDVVDHYEDYFGSEGESYTNADGEDITFWETPDQGRPDQEVYVADTGLSTRVTTFYND